MEYDVIVVGAGLSGLLTAYYLQEEGKKVLVLEAKETASGQTGRTTAKITSQHGLKYSQLADKIGMKAARDYARANEDAISQYERLVEKENIDCHFKRVPAYLYTTDKERVGELKREAELASLFNIEAYFREKTDLPFKVEGAVCFENQAQFDADSFVSHIAGKLDIREHAMVLKVKGRNVVTEEEIFTADHIVVASHYPFKNMPGFYFLRQHQERSYVAALSGCRKIEGIYYGVDPDGISLRQKGDILLLGGETRRTGEHTCTASYHNLAKTVQKYFPEAVVEDAWSAQDCMPHDGIPFIGRYSVFTPHIYVATGFQKWGMSTSMVAATVLRDEICGYDNPYRELFSPQRLHVRAGWNSFVKDVETSIKGLWNGLLKKDAPRCSHLGCGLHFNHEENTWECPCHGSRFSAEGRVMDNPAMREVGRMEEFHYN